MSARSKKKAALLKEKQRAATRENGRVLEPPIVAPTYPSREPNRQFVFKPPGFVRKLKEIWQTLIFQHEAQPLPPSVELLIEKKHPTDELRNEVLASITQRMYMGAEDDRLELTRLITLGLDEGLSVHDVGEAMVEGIRQRRREFLQSISGEREVA